MKIIQSLALIIASVFVLVACGGGSDGGGSDGGNTASTATVGVVFTDHPVEGYDQALATIISVELLGGEGGAVSLYSGPPVVIDLLALRNYQELFSITDNVPPGMYSKIRLQLESFVLIKLDDSGTVEESTDVQLVANGKVDLNPQEPFAVMAGATLFIVLDFDMEKSIKLTFAGTEKNPKLRPVIFVRISDSAPLGRIARIRGVIQSIDAVNNRFRLCEIMRIAQVSIHTRDDDHHLRCVQIATGEKTALFDDDGLPMEFSELQVDDPVTIVGRLLRTDQPYDDPVIQPLAAIGLHDEEWEGDWDDDHDWDFDCVLDIRPLSDDDDCDDSDGHRFGFSALLIERGAPGTFRIWKGEALSKVDSVTEQFGLLLSHGQGFTEGSVLGTQLYPKTWILSRNGRLLEREAIQPGQRAAVDGVINLVTDLTELRAALVVINEDGDTEPGTNFLRGEIIGVDTVAGTIVVSTDGGQTCINVSAAVIVFIQFTGEGVENKLGSIDDLEPGQQIAAFGKAGEGDACFKAGAVIVNIPQAQSTGL